MDSSPLLTWDDVTVQKSFVPPAAPLGAGQLRQQYLRQLPILPHPHRRQLRLPESGARDFVGPVAAAEGEYGCWFCLV